MFIQDPHGLPMMVKLTQSSTISEKHDPYDFDKFKVSTSLSNLETSFLSIVLGLNFLSTNFQAKNGEIILLVQYFRPHSRVDYYLMVTEKCN